MSFLSLHLIEFATDSFRWAANWWARVRFGPRRKAPPSRCPPMALPPSRAGLATRAVPARRGCSSGGPPFAQRVSGYPRGAGHGDLRGQKHEFPRQTRRKHRRRRRSSRIRQRGGPQSAVVNLCAK